MSPLPSLRDAAAAPPRRRAARVAALVIGTFALLGNVAILAGGASATGPSPHTGGAAGVVPVTGPPIRIAQDNRPPQSVAGRWRITGMGLSSAGQPLSVVALEVRLAEEHTDPGRLREVEPVGSDGIIFTDVLPADGTATFEDGRYSYDAATGDLQIWIDFRKDGQPGGYSLSVRGFLNSTMHADAGRWTFAMTASVVPVALGVGQASFTYLGP